MLEMRSHHQKQQSAHAVPQPAALLWEAGRAPGEPNAHNPTGPVPHQHDRLGKQSGNAFPSWKPSSLNQHIFHSFKGKVRYQQKGSMDEKIAKYQRETSINWDGDLA